MMGREDTAGRASEELAKREHEAHRPVAGGLWRELYAAILRSLEVESVIDLGAGPPELLKSLSEVSRRIAIDAGSRWEPAYERLGVGFYTVDLNSPSLPVLEPVGAVVCTDVLEHLLFPRRVIEWVKESLLEEDGIFLTHVPNEFTLRRMLGVMFGRRDAVYYHPHCEEAEDPHLRRFTDIGMKRLLSGYFAWNIGFSYVHYGRAARHLSQLRIPVPYCLQPGPGYVSTNSAIVADRVRRALSSISPRTRRSIND